MRNASNLHYYSQRITYKPKRYDSVVCNVPVRGYHYASINLKQMWLHHEPGNSSRPRCYNITLNEFVIRKVKNVAT